MQICGPYVPLRQVIARVLRGVTGRTRREARRGIAVAEDMLRESAKQR
jgi:hypothetical protein